MKNAKLNCLSGPLNEIISQNLTFFRYTDNCLKCLELVLFY